MSSTCASNAVRGSRFGSMSLQDGELSANLRNLDKTVRSFVSRVEQELVDGLHHETTWEQLWREGHVIDHLPDWECACDRGPSYAVLHQTFSHAMNKLTVVGLKVQHVE